MAVIFEAWFIPHAPGIEIVRQNHISLRMKIDVIIPALNESERIGHAVERAWELGPDRVLVVDGGSTDQTARIAREKNAEVFSCQPSRSRQQNHGAEQSTADVLLFLHADTWLAPVGLSQIVQAMKNPDTLGGAFCQRIESEGWIYRLLERGNDARARTLRSPYGDQGLFFRRDVFEQLGRFPDVELMEDLLLIRKLRRLSRPVLLPGPLHISARRWKKHGVVRQTARNWTLLAAQRLGAPPKSLAKFYPSHNTK